MHVGAAHPVKFVSLLGMGSWKLSGHSVSPHVLTSKSRKLGDGHIPAKICVVRIAHGSVRRNSRVHTTKNFANATHFVSKWTAGQVGSNNL